MTRRNLPKWAWRQSPRAPSPSSIIVSMAWHAAARSVTAISSGQPKYSSVACARGGPMKTRCSPCSLFGVGGLLLGIATMRARVFPRGAGVLLILGVVGLGAFVNVFLGAAMLFGLVGLGWIGYALLTAQGEAKAIP